MHPEVRPRLVETRMGRGKIEMEVTTSKLLKSQESSHFLHHSHHQLVPLTVFDRIARNNLPTMIIAFHQPTPSNEAMKEGLSMALSHYPHYSGRLRSDHLGRPCILLNDAGVRLVEATISSTLNELLPLDSSRYTNLTDLHPSTDSMNEELLRVQLNRCSCGGLIIGFTAKHRVADGHAVFFFLLAWARLAQGLPLEHQPYHDRAAISAPRIPPQILVDHLQVDFKEGSQAARSAEIDLLRVHFSAGFISCLKAKVSGDEPSRRYSTFQCLLAHLWKKLMMARGLQKKELTTARIRVDSRARLQPPIPTEYFGNVVLIATHTLTVGELLEQSYAQVANVIQDAMKKINDAYLKSLIDYGEVLREGRGWQAGAVLEELGGNVLDPMVDATCWLGLNHLELSFGSGAPAAFLPSPCMAREGLMIFVSSFGKKGHVDVFVGVRREQAGRFMLLVHDPISKL